MNISKITTYKNGLPAVTGQEVRSICVDLTIGSNLQDSTLKAFEFALTRWIAEAVGVEASFEGLEGASKLFIADEDETIHGFIAVERYRVADLDALEVQIVTKFYKGLETTRIRAISSSTGARVQVSTFLESRNNSVALLEIPRIGDSLAQALAAEPNLRIQVDKYDLGPQVLEVTAQNISQSPMALYNVPGQMPIVGFLQNQKSREYAPKLAEDSYGLAHVVLLSEELFENLRNKTENENKFFVYWRDGSPDITWFDMASEAYKFKRQLFARSLREESFISNWRTLIATWAFSRPASRPVVDVSKPEGIDAEKFQELEIELAVKTEEATAEKRRRQAVEQERDELFAQYDETHKNWQRKIQEATDLSAKLHGKIRSGKVSAKDFIVQVDLSGDIPTQNALDHLSIITELAIVFTENAARSWPEAKKDGYKKPAVMEKSLEALARFAMDFRLKAGQLGMGIQEYAEREFALDWIPKDDDLPNKEFTFEGQTWNQEKHVKADITVISQGPKDLGRIHFDLDTVNFRVIVNHIGGKQYKNKK